MGFNTEYGYTPESIPALINRLIPYINAQFGTSYTYESFQGTNFYRFAYSIAQLMSELEVDTGEIYNKLQDYFRATNEIVLIPRTPLEGLTEQFNSAGFVVSFDQSTPGVLGTCVDADDTAEDYETVVLPKIIETLALYTVAGLTYSGAEAGDYTFSNGQTFTYNFDLPTIKEALLKATITISLNNTSRIFTVAEIRTIIDDNIKEMYSLGNDFEPLKYLTTKDLPFAATIELAYTFTPDPDPEDWVTSVYTANFKDLITYVKTNIEVTIS